MRAHPTHEPYPSLLASQIRLPEARRADVARLAADGVEPDEILVDAIANDLVGARLMIRAALAVPPPGGVSEADRAACVLWEREAGDLLRVVSALLSARTR